MSVAARVGGYLASQMHAAGGTELESEIARVVGSLLATGAKPSTDDIAAVCLARGVSGATYAGGKAPAYGTVARVLSILRGIGSVGWEVAHVRRWHGDAVRPGAPVPVRQPDGTFRLAVRRLAIVGWAATLLAGGVAPRADSIVSDARARLASRVRPARPDPPEAVREELRTRPTLSIESAPRADGTRSAYAILGAWRPPDD